VLILGGIETFPDGGPAEIFDPEDPTSGFQLGPNMKHVRGYHSAAIVLPDGSVIMGGDPNGGATRYERHLPSYFFKPRPTITGSPPPTAHGAAFSVDTPTPGAIAEVVLMSPGAVTHGFNQNQRYVGCAVAGRTATAVEATAPSDRTIAPPGGTFFSSSTVTAFHRRQSGDPSDVSSKQINLGQGKGSLRLIRVTARAASSGHREHKRLFVSARSIWCCAAARRRPKRRGSSACTVRG
jgi:hypothetical protein